MNRWTCTNHFHRKNVKRARAVFLLAPTANMLSTNQFFIGCMKWLHAVFLEPIWEPDSFIFFSRLTDGTSHSSSDLFYFTLLLVFTWTNYSKSNSLSPSPFYTVEQNYFKSKSSSLLSANKIILGQNSFSSLLFLDKKI